MRSTRCSPDAAAKGLAVDPTARAWSEHLGFQPFGADAPDPVDLNLLTADIATTLELQPPA